MDSKQLRAAYNRLKSGEQVNVRSIYGDGSPLDVLLPERAIEISSEDYDILSSLNGMEGDISYRRFGMKRPEHKSTMALSMLSFTRIGDDKLFVSFPDAVWELEMALIDHYIFWCEFNPFTD